MKFRNLLVAGSALAVAAPSFATGTPIDVSSVTDQITAQATPIGLIGAAVLLLVVGIKAYKWVRRAM